MAALRLSAVLAATLAWVATGAPASAQYRPHRAVYEISLADAAMRGNGRQMSVEAARGRLVYEFLGSACEGWTTNLRFVTELQLGEGQTHVSDIRSNTVESADGKEMRFVTRSFINNAPTEQADGLARREGDRVRVELRRPRTAMVELQGPILFPTQHMAESLAAARRGERLFSADIYDGSESGEKVFGTTTVLRPAIRAPAQGHPTDIEGMRGVARWPMTISFFERGEAGAGGEQVPNYELTTEIYENGVTHSLLIAYVDFALRGTMTSFEFLPETPCN